MDRSINHQPDTVGRLGYGMPVQGEGVVFLDVDVERPVLRVPGVGHLHLARRQRRNHGQLKTAAHARFAQRKAATVGRLCASTAAAVAASRLICGCSRRVFVGVLATATGDSVLARPLLAAAAAFAGARTAGWLVGRVARGTQRSATTAVRRSKKMEC